MRMLKQKYASAFQMFEELGEYYESQHLFGMSHSRIRRCEILMDFVKENFEEDADFAECIRQALVFDLYYRENSKSRPAWAGDCSSFKKITYFYCKNGKMSHIEPFDYDFLGDLDGFSSKSEKKHWVLFSYDKRDPLSHQARAEYVYPEQDMQDAD